jgi:hypothetical protein
MGGTPLLKGWQILIRIFRHSIITLLIQNIKHYNIIDIGKR